MLLVIVINVQLVQIVQNVQMDFIYQMVIVFYVLIKS